MVIGLRVCGRFTHYNVIMSYTPPGVRLARRPRPVPFSRCMYVISDAILAQFRGLLWGTPVDGPDSAFAGRGWHRSAAHGRIITGRLETPRGSQGLRVGHWDRAPRGTIPGRRPLSCSLYCSVPEMRSFRLPQLPRVY